jgi:anti-anti-sigma factor
VLDGEAGFSTSTETISGCEVIRLRGELDMISAAELASALGALDGSGAPVVVDLSELSFIDSHGLHVLLSARPGGRTPNLICPDGNVSRLLTIVQAGKAVPIYASFDDLLAGLLPAR